MDALVPPAEKIQRVLSQIWTLWSFSHWLGSQELNYNSLSQYPVLLFKNYFYAYCHWNSFFCFWQKTEGSQTQRSTNVLLKCCMLVLHPPLHQLPIFFHLTGNKNPLVMPGSLWKAVESLLCVSACVCVCECAHFIKQLTRYKCLPSSVIIC